jgi:hypothetical protein
MSGDRATLEAELLDWMRARPLVEDEARFERLALALFRVQYAHCAPYRRLCDARGYTPERVAGWQAIPAVPTGAFKEMPLRCFPASATRKTFLTSGTSGQERGALHLDRLDLYEASLLASLESLLFPELLGSDARTHIVVLAPSPEESPESSLSHMFGELLSVRGDAQSGHLVTGGALDVEAAIRSLDAACRAEGPLCVCGTAFAFVHLLDALAERGLRFALPAGSRVMETGGFKGRSRVVERDDLYASLQHHLGVAAPRIVNQYGMTELGSQFYDSTIVDPTGPRRKLGPPWARVRIVDPETLLDVEGDRPGLITIHDLANTGSVAALQTADLGRFVAGRGFEVLGREASAEARGCSIAADVMLAERA